MKKYTNHGDFFLIILEVFNFCLGLPITDKHQTKSVSSKAVTIMKFGWLIV